MMRTVVARAINLLLQMNLTPITSQLVVSRRSRQINLLVPARQVAWLTDLDQLKIPVQPSKTLRWVSHRRAPGRAGTIPDRTLLILSIFQLSNRGLKVLMDRAFPKKLGLYFQSHRQTTCLSLGDHRFYQLQHLPT